MSSPPKSFFSSPRNVIRVVAVILLLAGTYGQFMLHRDSAPVAESTLYDIAMTFTTSAGPTPQRAQARAGQAFNVSVADRQGKLQAAFVVTAAGAESVRLEGGFGCSGASTPYPPFTARLGTPAAIRIPAQSGAPPCALEMVVTKLAQPSAAK